MGKQQPTEGNQASNASVSVRCRRYFNKLISSKQPRLATWVKGQENIKPLFGKETFVFGFLNADKVSLGTKEMHRCLLHITLLPL